MNTFSGSWRVALPAFVAIVALLQGATSQAADSDARIAKAEEMLKARFEKADVNHDALLTREEARGVMPRVYSHFDAIDTAHKGTVSVDDIETFLMRKLQERQGSKAAM